MRAAYKGVRSPAALETELPQSCLGVLLLAWVKQVRAWVPAAAALFDGDCIRAWYSQQHNSAFLNPLYNPCWQVRRVSRAALALKTARQQLQTAEASHLGKEADLAAAKEAKDKADATAAAAAEEAAAAAAAEAEAAAAAAEEEGGGGGEEEAEEE